KVQLVMGGYSSAQCVPMAQKVDAPKQFMWIDTCVAWSVIKCVFRSNVTGDFAGT
ncbi:MAG: ABC transporter ATP-binding protein, partial [Deltaproteobacteria bacterium]|nr:ABC transporter ATP-binding protein [Deltaproteobacteria bacterium]